MHRIIHCTSKIKSVIYYPIFSIFFLGVFLALGMLSLWHGQLISKGETSIEANINKAETIRMKELGRTYANPYNFGKSKNWKIFLGLVQGR